MRFPGNEADRIFVAYFSRTEKKKSIVSSTDVIGEREMVIE